MTQAFASTAPVRRVGVSGEQLAFPDLQADAGPAPWTHRRVRKGDYLYRAGMPANALYVVNFGCFKSSLPSNDGAEQVLDFPMRGEVMGADALAGNVYATDMQAIDDSEVVVLPLSEFEAAATRQPRLRHHLYRHLAHGLKREYAHVQKLGSMRAAQRVADFLLDLSARFAAHGYSARAFVLRMSRAEIGSYLGLTLESVSRTLSRFQHEGLLRIDLRDVELVDVDALRQLARGDAAEANA